MTGVDLEPETADEARAVDRVLGGAQLSLGFMVASFGPYLATIADELGRPRAQLVWLTSTFGVGLLLAAVAGPTVLRWGAGRVLRAAALAMAVGSAAMAVSPVLALVGLGSALVGLGCAAIVLVTPVLLSGPGAARRLTRTVGAASAAGVSAPLTFGLLEHLGQPGRLAMLVPVPILVAVAARRAVSAPAPPPSDGSRPAAGPAAVGGLRIVLAVAAEFCFVVWAAARLVDTGASLGTAAALSTAFPIGMAAGRLLGHRLAARPGAASFASLGAMVGTGIVFAGDSAPIVAAGVLVSSLGISLLYPIMLAQLVHVPNLSARHSASIGSLASGTAILSAPAVLGWLDTVIELRTAFLLPIPLLLALLLLLPRRKSRGLAGRVGEPVEQFAEEGPFTGRDEVLGVSEHGF
ncbi:hypothetical protein GCM10027447_20090 [Glycomyces halotolerans]